ncbi:hypothetical protein PYCCODRAFT_1360731 [Trametes coccinea BRFM310]|uniref:DUF155 domain-containing protein n=1 Tax=Trametes coccinea (strain BRFM310) TaxID=1353009 RepID=A0A1Y2IZN2_TRAC3|nr:hypothetical protein PYCCODRAFT_1360731 [Trametes coccinea BRFM310]
MNFLNLASRQLRRDFTTLPRVSQWHQSPRVASRPQAIRTMRRGFAEVRNARTGADAPLPKPKASTALRRTASASLPIRSNPTPTRSDIQPVFTYATAERYVMQNLRHSLPEGAVLLHDAWWVPKWTDAATGKDGEVFVFANGSFVCWGIGEEGAMRFAQEVLAKSGAEIAPLKEPETEDLEFVTDPEENTRLQGDLIVLGRTPPLSSEDTMPLELPPSVLPSETVLARYAFSHALSRSTALSGLESSLDHYLSSVASLPHNLQKTGKPGLGRRALVMKLGELMRFRQGLNLNRENFSDTPDFYWSEPVLEAYFNSLSNALEIRSRTRSVNDKITYAAEMQSVLRELLTETSAHRMELIIIALIAVEVVICLIRDGPELWEMAFGKTEEEQPAESTEKTYQV